MPKFHNALRGNPRSFQKCMETIDAVSELQKKDERLRIHSAATVTSTNVEEIRQLTTYLYDRHPAMDHHNLGVIRGDPKNPGLEGPGLDAYLELDRYTKRLWADREEGRFGAIVDPMLTITKVRTARAARAGPPRALAGRSMKSMSTGTTAGCKIPAFSITEYRSRRTCR